MGNYLTEHGGVAKTPQSEPIPGRTDQAQNNAGGYGWGVDVMTRLHRFLILGAEGGTYYVGERKLVRENMDALSAAVAEHGPAVVGEIVAVSSAGRAKSNEPALFALAYCSLVGTDADKESTEVRSAAYAALPKVARTSTHLFAFLNYRKAIGGGLHISRGLRGAIDRWYNERSLGSLAMQLVKYRQRDGWTHRDVLRIARPVPDSTGRDVLFKFAITGELNPDRRAMPAEESEALGVVANYLALQDPALSAEAAALIVREFGMPRETVQPEHLKAQVMWEALLENMPPEAMLRNLATMARNGTLHPMGANEQTVTAKLLDQQRLVDARVHPLTVLNAAAIYGAGGREGFGLSKGGSFPVSEGVVGTLGKAFKLAFGAVDPAGKRFLLGLDVSGSMGNAISGSPVLSCRDATAAMALVTAATEPFTHTIAFTGDGGRAMYRHNAAVTPFPITGDESLTDLSARMAQQDFGATDCALPMLYALEHGIEVDLFVIYTDNETWVGNVHPTQALAEYRRKHNPQARLVTVGMNSAGFTIADPSDPLQLDVVGFDTATPNMLAAFARGEI